MLHLLSLAMLICSVFSLIGDFYIIATFFIVKNMRDKVYMKIVYFIAVCDCFSSIGSSIGIQPDGTSGCYFQAIIVNIFYLCSIFWTVILTRLLHKIVMKAQGFPLEAYSPHSLWAWCLPVVLTILPLSTNTYGHIYSNSETQCFFAQRNDSPRYGVILWIVVSFYGWVWISIFFIFACFAEMALKIRRDFSHRGSLALTSLLYRQVEKCWLYPVVSVVCWILPTFSDLASAAFQDYQFQGIAVFRYFSVLLPILHGFMNACVFVRYNKEMLVTEWGRVLREAGFCFGRNKVFAMSVVFTAATQTGAIGVFGGQARENRGAREDARYELDSEQRIAAEMMNVDVTNVVKHKPRLPPRAPSYKSGTVPRKLASGSVVESLMNVNRHLDDDGVPWNFTNINPEQPEHSNFVV